MLQYCSKEKECKRIMCESFILDKESDAEVTLTGDVQFRDLQQKAAVCSNNTHEQDTH